MEKSIGKRLFMQIMLVLLIFIIIALLANTILIRPIYYGAKRKVLIEAGKFIKSLDGDYENNLDIINSIEEKLAARIIISDKENILYLSMAKMIKGKIVNDFDKINDKIIPVLPVDFLMRAYDRIIEKSTVQIDENTVLSKITTFDSSNYLILQSFLNDSDTLTITVEMQSLDEAIRIFNFFLIATAFICMIISAFLAYFMAKRFVKPIRNMNKVTRAIANLDFGGLCEIETKDELEELGDNINILSKNLEATIEELRQELKNAKRLGNLRKRFISTISHELKTPISLLQGYSIGMKSSICDDKEKRDYYAMVIADEAQRLGELVNELMDLTQMEEGYITLHKTDFEINQYLLDIADKYSAANPDINISLKKTDGEIWVCGDIKLIERVLNNYLSNAISHVDDNKNIDIRAEEKDNIINVSVFNSGKHIPSDKIKDIWNSFYRIDDARSRNDGGHGLGLAIVKNIQNAHKMPYGVRNITGGVIFSFGINAGIRP